MCTLTKEEVICKLLIDTNLDQYCIRNKCVGSKASLKRPDFYFSLYDEYALIVEVDEFMHKNHDAEEEIERMQQIYSDLQTEGKTHVIFIRYNPNSYIKIESSGTHSIKTEEMNTLYRQDYLINLLSSICIYNLKEDSTSVKLLDAMKAYNNEPGMYIYYLFYNGHTLENESIINYDYLQPKSNYNDVLSSLVYANLRKDNKLLHNKFVLGPTD